MYQKSVTGRRPDNLAKALECHTIALRVLGSLGKNRPIAVEHVSIALVHEYSDFVGNGRSANKDMENAMRCFDMCKEVRPDEILLDEFVKKHCAKGADARKAA